VFLSIEYGTVAMTSTEFRTNVLKGDSGVVVLDVESALEEDEGNCDGNYNANGINTADDRHRFHILKACPYYY